MASESFVVAESSVDGTPVEATPADELEPEAGSSIELGCPVSADAGSDAAWLEVVSACVEGALAGSGAA